MSEVPGRDIHRMLLVQDLPQTKYPFANTTRAAVVNAALVHPQLPQQLQSIACASGLLAPVFACQTCRNWEQLQIEGMLRLQLSSRQACRLFACGEGHLNPILLLFAACCKAEGNLECGWHAAGGTDRLDSFSDTSKETLDDEVCCICQLETASLSRNFAIHPTFQTPANLLAWLIVLLDMSNRSRSSSIFVVD